MSSSSSYTLSTGFLLGEVLTGLLFLAGEVLLADIDLCGLDDFSGEVLPLAAEVALGGDEAAGLGCGNAALRNSAHSL